ncbi:MAG: cell division GTPase, partial [halophilic archaeon J07HX5]
MQVGAIGIGQAGGKILDTFLAYDEEIAESPIRSALAVNTAETDLLGLTHVGDDQKLLIGEDTQNGGGVGADNETGASVTTDNIERIHDSLEQMPRHELDGFLILTSLGGGTGSGGTPVIARHINSMYDSLPVYVVGVLPSKREGQLYAYNAARSLQTLLQGASPNNPSHSPDPDSERSGRTAKESSDTRLIGPDESITEAQETASTPLVDNIILIDNDAYSRPDESLEQAWKYINRTIAQAVTDLFAAGEPLENKRIPESVVDTADIKQTLNGGRLSTIGYATSHLETDTTQTLLDRVRGTDSTDLNNHDFDQQEAELRIMNLVREATQTALGFDTTLESVTTGLVLVAGPTDVLNRRGIQRSRDWIQDQIEAPAVRGGDYPRDQPEVQTALLLSGVHESDRLRELYAQAARARQTIEDIDDTEAADTALTDPPTPPDYEHHI